MNDIVLIISITIVMCFVVWISILIRRPDHDNRLFHKLMDKGCIDCGGDFALGVKPADDGKIGMMCQKCDKQYQIHLDDEKAWTL